MIFGTAGHIDHGKSTLVKALTGVDPDRLREEKERGITLDLGYAYTTIASRRIGFVDVPGHERLVRNMLAGATGIDRVLLVVAADDGVMPQTREHLAIVGLLGLDRGCVVLTKIDRVDAARLDAVRAEVAALLAGTAFADAPVLPVSAVTGAGLDALRDWLHRTAGEPVRRAADRLFRLAIDRAFTLPGAGLVVTGTVHAGQVTVGDEMVIGPVGAQARIRAIHALNAPAGTAVAGQRCSLNLVTDCPRESIARGDWIVAPAAFLPVTRLDARLTLLGPEFAARTTPGAVARPLRHWTQVHVHHGTADLSAHVAILNAAERIEPGTSDLVQLVFERPTLAAWGDRIVVRDQSAMRTIGGATVLDIVPPVRRRRAAERLEALHALETPDDGPRLQAWLDRSPQGVSGAGLGAAWGLAADRLAALAEGAGARKFTIAGDGRWFAGPRWQRLLEALVAALAAYHAAQADEAGIDRDRLRRLVDPALERTVFQALVAQLLEAGTLATSGPWLRLASHAVKLSPQEQLFREKVVPTIDAAAFDPPWMRDIAKSLRLDERTARNYLRRLARAGQLSEVVPDLFYSERSIRRLAAIAADLERTDGVIETPRFRDRVDLGRKRAIQILEYFDRVGYTRRDGDSRWVRPGSSLATEGGARVDADGVTGDGPGRKVAGTASTAGGTRRSPVQGMR